MEIYDINYLAEVEKKTEQKSKVFSIVDEIQNEPSYLKLTQKFFQIYMLKYRKSPEEVGVEYIDFVCGVVDEKFATTDTSRDIIDVRAKSRTLSWRLKQRWLKSCLDSIDKKPSKYIQKEYEELKSECLKYGKMRQLHLNIKKPEEITELEKPEEIKELRIDYLKEWASTNDYPITYFPYLEDLSESKIRSAFTHDLVLLITEILRDRYKYDLNKMIVKNVGGLPTGIFAPHSSGKKANTMNVQKTKELSYKSEERDTKSESGTQIDVSYGFSLCDDGCVAGDDMSGIEPLKIQLVNKDTEKKAVSKIYLDKQDLEIIRFAFSNEIANSYSVYETDILEYLGLTNTKGNRENIENRLLKLPYYTFYTKELDEDGEIKKQATFNLFSRISIEKDESGRKVVHITRAIVEEIEKRSTEIMYKKELKKLKSHQAKDLAYLLEGRRVNLITTGQDVKTKYYKFDLDYLKWYIHVNKGTLKKEMAQAEKAFKEIKENQFIIKDYKVCKSHFEVLFYEDIERRKLIFRNTILSLPNYLVSEI